MVLPRRRQGRHGPPTGALQGDNAAALVEACLAGIGLAWVPDYYTDEHVASGALVPVMTRHPPPPAAAYILRPPGQHPARKIRVLTELLIEYCNQPKRRLQAAG